MKKYSLLKAIGIVLIIFMFMTWFIPTGQFTGGKIVSAGYEPMGLFDLILTPFRYFDWSFFSKIKMTDETINLVGYVGNILALLSIGVFYKVLNKTGAYGNLITNLTNKLTNQRKQFAILTIVIFSLLSSFTGVTLLLFLLVPFFVTLLLKLNYTKITSFAATVLPILVGRACAITSSDITGINNIVYGVPCDVFLIFRILLLVIFIAITSLYVITYKSLEVDNKVGKKQKEEIVDPMYDEIVDKNKGYGILVFFSLIFFILLGICMYNWYYVFNIKGFSDAYNDIMANTISGYPFVANIFGNMEVFGYWTGFSMSAILIILSIVIAFIYSVTVEEFIDAFKNGVGKMSRVAIYVVLASTVMVFLNDNASNIFYTISGFINNKITFKPLSFSSLMSGTYSVFMNDYYAIALQTKDMLGTYFSSGFYNISIMTVQLVHGIVSMLTPTSIFLVAGLSYLEIPYKTWISYIWKLVLGLLTVGILLLLIVSLI